jgi:hypothetical protein
LTAGFPAGEKRYTVKLEKSTFTKDDVSELNFIVGLASPFFN